MLKLPNLDDQDFESIVNAAVSELSVTHGAWTPSGEHEPGLTLIELFAHLKEQQQKQINLVGSRSLYKFLPMLGLDRKHAQCAAGEVAFQGDGYLPKGTKLCAGDLAFETCERIYIADSEVIRLGSDISYMDYAENTRTTRHIFENAQPLYIGFSKALPENAPVQIYAELSDGHERNPITDIDSFIRLAELRYEYFGEKDGVTDWHSLSVLRDETVDYLYSGHIRFSLDGKHLSSDGVYPIRITPEICQYERPPALTGLHLNAVSVAQQDTKCEAVYFTYADFQDNRMLFDSFLAFQKQFELYIRADDGWKLSNVLDIPFMVRVEEQRMFRLATGKRTRLKSLFKGKRDEEPVFLLVVYDAEFYPDRHLGVSTGMANQVYRLPSRYENIVYDSFSLLAGRRNSGQQVWDKADSLDAAPPDGRQYLLEPEKAVIRFGDNEHGKVPPLGESNIITVISLKTTKAENGNVKAGAIDRFFKSATLDGIRFTQITAASGGWSRETDAEAMSRMRSEFTVNPHRAVTIEDYERIVRSAQGLMISDVTVIPSSQDNSVAIVVDTVGSTVQNPVPQRCLDNVAGVIAKRKLITTHVEVRRPNYVGLDVHGEILMRSGVHDPAQLIEQILLRYLHEVERKKTEKTVYNIELCGLLERLDCVLAVKYIDWSVRSPGTGYIGRKGHSGDMTFMPYEKIYLRENNILITRH